MQYMNADLFILRNLRLLLKHDLLLVMHVVPIDSTKDYFHMTVIERA